MPTFLRMMEILSCSMAGFLPYILLLIYPFRNHMRLKGYVASLLTLVMTAGQLYYDVLSALGTAPTGLPLPLLRIAAFLVLALLSISAPVWKNLLNTFSVINLSLLIGAAAGSSYNVKCLLITLGLQFLLLIPYAVNLALCLSPTLNESDAPIWRWLWIAPAIGSVVAFLLLLIGTDAKVLMIAMIAAILLAAAAAAVLLHKTETEMITLLLRKEKPAKAAQPIVQVTTPTGAYYTTLQTRMAESEHSCKEMLLQVMSMEDDLNRQDYDRLRSRLNTLRMQLSPEIASTGNKQIDAVLTYYTRQAMMSSIKIASSVTLPEMSNISDEDMSVLLSCLLDNALDACREQTSGTRRIAMATYQDEELLQIGIKNTYASPMDPQCERLNICRSIAERYDGKLAVIDRDGAMQVVVTLTV